MKPPILATYCNGIWLEKAIVAPTSIPSSRGTSIKTDRIDAGQLAQFYANGLVSIVRIPDVKLEQDRDLMRSRQNPLQQQTELRKHIQVLCYRHEIFDRS